ncbi:hypothetical protein SuNHUV7_23530 (plasmid) [Pseudoseohaeicola sp. NH-UV-7]
MKSRRSFLAATMAASVFSPARGYTVTLVGETPLSRFAFGSCVRQ